MPRRQSAGTRRTVSPLSLLGAAAGTEQQSIVRPQLDAARAEPDASD
jgi:hypothetical protein